MAMIYTWELAQVGDASPTNQREITDQQIADYCRAARYENLVYTNQPAARESGLPGIVAPPAMILAIAPPQLAGVAASRGCSLPGGLALNPTRLALTFQGAWLTHGDTLTTQTHLSAKPERDGHRCLVFTVQAINQNGQVVAAYEGEYLWE